MIWSKYNILFENEDHEHFLFNTTTQMFLHLPQDTFKIIEKIRENPDTYQQFSIGNALKRWRIIVEVDDFATISINSLFQKKYDPTTLNLTIGVTLDCNFDCPYCYESKKTQYMGIKEEEYIKRFIQRNYLKKLTVSWYGGEPLLNFGTISRLSEYFLSLNDLEYNASIVTNGYLLTPEIIETFEKYRIEEVQITLDGPEHIHNMRRPLKSGGPTFAKILSNIELLLKLNPSITISIRTIIDKENLNYYKELYCFLMEKFDSKRVNIGIGYTHDFFNNLPVLSHNLFFKHYEQDYLILKDDDELLSLFYPKPQANVCTANSLNGYVIAPNGDVYKCWEQIGRKEYSVGNISNPDSFDQRKIAHYLCDNNYLMNSECRECIYFPICDGGCPLQRQQIGNANDSNVCCVYKNTLITYLELYYKKVLKGLN